jgi:hypothetical protein
VFLPSFTKTNNKSCGDKPQSVRVWLSEQDRPSNCLCFFNAHLSRQMRVVRFRKQPAHFQAPRLPRASNSPYFYLFASLILAKADCRSVVQGQSSTRLYSLFPLWTLLFEPFSVSGPLLVILWLIVVLFNPSLQCFLGFLSVF